MKYKICVSGAAVTDRCAEDTMQKTKTIGAEVAKRNGVLITGATSGVPFWASLGTKEAGGFSIGVSPAYSEKEHVKKYRLPTESFDIIIFTGFGYSGRNLLLTRSSDGIILVCGRIGSLNEFTIAFEDKKPIGVLSESGGIADDIDNIISKSNRGPGKVVYDSDPKRLVEKLIELIDKDKAETKPDTPY